MINALRNRRSRTLWLVLAIIGICSVLAWKAPNIRGKSNAAEAPQSSFTDFRTGDLIFQRSSSGQGRAIQLATDSKFSHVGIVLIRDGKPMVFEAVQPVRLTSLREFIGRTPDRNFAVTRLKNAAEVWNKASTECLEQSVATHLGKDYDAFFNWGDDELYCSELAWKVYSKCTGLEAGELKPLKSYHLDHPEVQRVMKQRYGNHIPWDEPMISPAAMFKSSLFQVIHDTEC